MTLHEARLIREIKRNCTYRYLAEVYYPLQDKRHGIQAYGEDLCIAAFQKLYPRHHPYKLTTKQLIKLGSKMFRLENKSKIGNFYWWE